MPVEVEVHTVPHFKAQRMIKWGAEDKSVLALLCSKIAVSSWAV